VNVRPARPDAGKPWPELRWVDPDTRKHCSETCTGCTFAQAWVRAEQLSLDVVKRRAEIKRGLPPSPPLAAYDILKNAKAYIDSGLDTDSPHTRSNYGRALTTFVTWLDARKLRTLDKLTDIVLRDYFNERKARPKADGKRRKADSVQAEIKPVRAFLAWLRDEHLDGRGAHFTRDMLSRGLPLKGKKASERREAKDMRVLTLPQRLDLLRAALLYDACHIEQEPCAPDFALFLLTGMRRYELTMIQVCEVVRKASDWERDVYEDLIDLPGAKAKRGVPRPVYLTGFTRLGLELVREMCRGRKGHEYVTACTYDVIAARCAELREYGAPEFSVKDLRSTCCTCETGLTGVSPRLRYERQGHTEQEAIDSYERPGASMPRAATLEEIMRCEPELQLVLDLLRERNDLRIVPRGKRRPDPRPKPKGVNVLGSQQA
jgi:integrase